MLTILGNYNGKARIPSEIQRSIEFHEIFRINDRPQYYADNMKISFD